MLLSLITRKTSKKKREWKFSEWEMSSIFLSYKKTFREQSIINTTFTSDKGCKNHQTSALMPHDLRKSQGFTNVGVDMI